MKFWICPKCVCLNDEKNTVCDGCGIPALTVMVLPNLQWVKFDNEKKASEWVALIKKMGGKVWKVWNEK